MLVSVCEGKAKQEQIDVDHLPCYFFNDEENIKRSVYFDSQIKKYKESKETEEDKGQEQDKNNDVVVSLRGHKIVGREVDVSQFCDSNTCEYQMCLANVEENQSDNHAIVTILNPVNKLTVWEEGGEYCGNNNITKLQRLLNYRNILCSKDSEDKQD